MPFFKVIYRTEPRPNISCSLDPWVSILILLIFVQSVVRKRVNILIELKIKNHKTLIHYGRVLGPGIFFFNFEISTYLVEISTK